MARWELGVADAITGTRIREGEAEQAEIGARKQDSDAKNLPAELRDEERTFLQRITNLESDKLIHEKELQEQQKTKDRLNEINEKQGLNSDREELVVADAEFSPRQKEIILARIEENAAIHNERLNQTRLQDPVLLLAHALTL